MTWRYATHCWVSLGELALARGDLAQAGSFADQSLEIAAPTRSRKYESRAWRLRGEIAAARRAWDEAEDGFRRALQIAQEIGHPRETWKTHVALGRLAQARGQPDAARGHDRAARELVEPILAAVTDPGLRRGLAESPEVREILDLGAER